MRSFAFIWYDRLGNKKLYRTKALGKEDAQVRYWQYQLRTKHRKHFLQGYEVKNGKRIPFQTLEVNS